PVYGSMICSLTGKKICGSVLTVVYVRSGIQTGNDIPLLNPFIPTIFSSARRVSNRTRYLSVRKTGSISSKINRYDRCDSRVSHLFVVGLSLLLHRFFISATVFCMKATSIPHTISSRHQKRSQRCLGSVYKCWRTDTEI